MTSLAPTRVPPAPSLDVSKMTKVQKLAALLIILGPETAAQILKSLDSADLDLVSAEMAQLPVITQEVRTEILREMSEVAVAAGTTLRGGMPFAQSALEKAVGAHKATDILSRVSPAPSQAVQRLGEMEVRHIFNLIRDEHTQTIALVASYLPPGKVSELFSLLRPESRDE